MHGGGGGGGVGVRNLGTVAQHTAVCENVVCAGWCVMRPAHPVRRRAGGALVVVCAMGAQARQSRCRSGIEKGGAGGKW